MNEFYVYHHVCPRTNEVVYVGKGKHGRAWDVTRSRAGNPDHLSWMKSLSKDGFTPDNWVVIFRKNLSESDAFKVEREELHSLGVRRFNRQSGERQHQSKITDAQAIEIFHKCWSGSQSRAEISLEYGISRSNVSMIKHKKQWKTTLSKETNIKYENYKLGNN